MKNVTDIRAVRQSSCSVPLGAGWSTLFILASFSTQRGLLGALWGQITKCHFSWKVEQSIPHILPSDSQGGVVPPSVNSSVYLIMLQRSPASIQPWGKVGSWAGGNSSRDRGIAWEGCGCHGARTPALRKVFLQFQAGQSQPLSVPCQLSWSETRMSEMSPAATQAQQ